MFELSRFVFAIWASSIFAQTTHPGCDEYGKPVSLAKHHFSFWIIIKLTGNLWLGWSRPNWSTTPRWQMQSSCSQTSLIAREGSWGIARLFLCGRVQLFVYNLYTGLIFFINIKLRKFVGCCDPYTYRIFLVGSVGNISGERRSADTLSGGESDRENLSADCNGSDREDYELLSTEEIMTPIVEISDKSDLGRNES